MAAYGDGSGRALHVTIPGGSTAGGLGVARQAAVIVDDTYYEESNAKPFENTFHGQRITIVTIPTTDMAYVDQARGAVIACDLQE